MAEEAAQEQSSPTASRPVRCVVKLGGAAITNKGALERIDEGSLRSACEQLQQAMSDGDGAPEKVLGMDWSRRHGDPTDPAVDAEGFAGCLGWGSTPTSSSCTAPGRLVTSKQVDLESIKEVCIQHW